MLASLLDSLEEVRREILGVASGNREGADDVARLAGGDGALEFGGDEVAKEPRAAVGGADIEGDDGHWPRAPRLAGCPPGC